MTIAFRAAASATNTGTSVTISKPAGTVDNDVLVAEIRVTGGTGETITPPAGWTLILRTNNSTAESIASYYKVASSEGASYTFSISPGNFLAGGISTFSGAKISGTIDASGGQVTSPASASVTAPSITPSVANCMLVGGYTILVNTTFTPPSGMTEDVDTNGGLGSGSLEMTHELYTGGTSATGTRVATAAASAVNIGQLIAIAPIVTEEELVIPRTIQSMPGKDGPTRAAMRAGALAYMVMATFVPQGELQAATTGNSLPQQARVAPRSNPSAYWQDNTQAVNLVNYDPFIELYTGLELPEVALPPPRSRAEAYAVAATFVVQDEPQTQTRFMPDFAKPAARARLAAYDVAVTFVNLDTEDPTNPERNGRILPEIAPPSRRAASDAYFVHVRKAVDDTAMPEAHQGSTLIPAAPAKTRAPAAAYWIYSWVTPDEVTPPDEETREAGEVSQPQRAAARARQSAYWIDYRNFGLEDEPHTQVQLLPERARAVARSKASAYEVSIAPAIPSEPQLQITSIPGAAPASRRAVVSAYWQNQHAVVNDEPHGLRSAIPERARRAERASGAAYWQDQKAVVQDEPQAVLGLVLPEVARQAQRASAAAYWRNGELAVQPEPALPVLLPSVAPVSRRAAVSAYVLAVAPQIGDGIIAWSILPEQVRSSRRATAAAYGISTRELAEELPPERPRGYIDQQPRPLPRANRLAYAAPLSGSGGSVMPPNFPATGGPVSGPFVVDAGAVWQAGAEAATVWQAGAEAAICGE